MNTLPDPEDLERLGDCVFALLTMQDGPLREYELMRLLDDAPREFGFPESRDGTHDLYRAHFILFHVLYRLRDELWANRHGHLEIGPLAICLHAYSEGEDALAVPDALRAYYLDLTHLENTRPADVDAMLNDFYERMLRDDRRGAALAEFELTDPVDEATIRRRYRELASQHHPDRGGSTARFQAINRALRVLIP